MCEHQSIMGSAELTLGRPSHVVSLGAFTGGDEERMLNLRYYLKSLENERKKIEAFQRELPLCMQLLNDEIEASKEQLADYRRPPAKPQSILSSTCEEDPSVKSDNLLPVLEEFIPIKNSAEDIHDDDQDLRPSGVLQTKFWSQAEAYAHGQEMVSAMTDKPYKKRDSMRMGSEDFEVAKPILNSDKSGGAFLPFSGPKKVSPAEQFDVSPHFRDSEASPCADMARSSSITEVVNYPQPIKETQSVAIAATTSYNNPNQATQRKPRRCWSPELHRRFVKALQQLGGSEVATPKQIRELMKVDGLTNDEVKSHLQKYRLHTRQPNRNFHATTAHAPPVMVLGGIWVPQEYAAEAAASVSQAAMPHQNVESGEERQTTHMQATPSYAEERYIHSASAPRQLHPDLFYDGEARPAATHSQGSSQGPLHQVSAHSSDAGREEESVGEEGNEGCSWKERYPEENVDSCYEGEAPNLRVHKWLFNHAAAHHELHESDSDAEDGRVYETPM